MGYSTYFNGSLYFNKPVESWLVEYINEFNRIRHMKRSPELIKEQYPNWEDQCFKGELGEEGEYFIGGENHSYSYDGKRVDTSVLNGNSPARTQPGLWCDWMINEEGNLTWDGAEKFYDYEAWLEYLINHFFEPLGYVLNGEITWEGEDSDDFGTIHVEDNVVEMQYGIKVMSMDQLSTTDMIEELERRGYVVSKPA